MKAKFNVPWWILWRSSVLVRLLAGLVVLSFLMCLPQVCAAQHGLPSTWFYSPISTPTCIAYSPDDATLAIGGTGGVQVIAAASGALEKCIATQANVVNSIAFSKDGLSLAIGGVNNAGVSVGVLEIWQVSSGKLVARLGTSSNSVLSVSFSPDGSTLAASGFVASSKSSTGNIELWNVAKTSRANTIKSTASTVQSIAFSPDGTMLASGGENSSGVLEIWKVANGKRYSKMATSATKINSVAFSPNGLTLADGGTRYDSTSNSNTGVLELWSVATAESISSLSTKSTGVTSVVFSPDGGKIADGNYTVYQQSGDIELWNAANGKLINAMQSANQESISSIAFSPDGQTIAGCAAYVNSSLNLGVEQISLWKVSTGAQSASFGTADYVGSLALAFSPDGKNIYGGGFATPAGFDVGWLGKWNATSGALVSGVTSTAVVGIAAIAVSADGLTIADCGGQSNSAGAPIELRNAATGDLISTIPSDSGQELTVLAFAPSGSILAVGGSNASPVDGVLELWNASNGKLISALNTSANLGVTSIAFSPDGSMLAVTGTGTNSKFNYGVVELWNVATGTLIRTFDTDEFEVSSVAFSPNGMSLADGGKRFIASSNSVIGDVEIWNVSTGTLMSSLPVLPKTAGVNTVAFSHDGFSLFAGTGIDLEAFSTSLFTLTGAFDVGGVAYLAVSPDDRSLTYVTLASVLVVAPNPFYGAIQVVGLTLNPATVAGGISGQGTVTLNQPATQNGATILLASSNSNAIVPKSVIVPAGAKSASFTIETLASSSQKSAVISAKFGSSSNIATLVISAPALTALTVNPTSVKGGTAGVGTVTISSPAPSGGFLISLSSSLASVSVPKTVTIPAGTTTASFTIKTVAVKSDTSVTLTAATETTIEKATLTITK